MGWFSCDHKWELLSETVTESKFECSMKAAGNLVKTMPHQLCDADRKHIQVFKCDECGKLKRFVEDI